jgi:translation initiation factor IF-2
LAKRVHQLAKELGVQAKAIVTKCEAEGIPNIENHMSSVSAGLEATIREWFSAAEASHTAVETAEKVDLTKVRVAPRRRGAKKSGDTDDADSGTESGSDTGTAVAEPPHQTAPPQGRPASTAAPAPAEPEGRAATTESAPPAPAPPAAPARPRHIANVSTFASAVPKEVPPVAPPPPIVEDDEPEVIIDEEEADAPVKGPPAPRAPMRIAPQNIPTRPTVTKPAGPRLEVQKPARLSGPKVVRIEQPEQMPAPRPRRAEGDTGVAARARRPGDGTGPAPTEGEGGDRSTARNKRRGGGSGPAGPGRKEEDKGSRRPAKATDTSGWSAQDLLEREQRLNRSGGFLRQRRRDQKIKGQPHAHRASTAAETGGAVKIATPFTIKDLSAATGVKASEIVKKLFLKGVMATVNSGIDVEQAQDIMLDFDIELQVEDRATGEALVLEEFQKREVVDLRPRSAVVTILGHVDHGKTSLLDKIRNTNVASGEAGGITQSTRAFLTRVSAGETDRTVCFLDTPGHEAFTEMRARGAHVTDIVVLVVAADDGVMPQTVESIAHAKAANVPLIVAINKIDLPGADTETNLNKIYAQLADRGLNPAAWGGETEIVKVSAATGRGIQELLELIAYTAELREYKADFGGPAAGTVIESRMLEGRGAVANLLVQQGKLSVGDIVVAGRAYGRVRDISGDRGEKLAEAYASTPVQISGIDEIPDAGDKFYVVKNLRQAQEAAEQRRHLEREAQLAQPKLTLDTMFAQMESSGVKELLLVLKADVQGSVDAIRRSVESVATAEVKVRVLHSAVGGITESDVNLAAASRAIIIGFNVIPSGKARQAAEQRGVEIRTYQVIYNIVDDVKAAAEGMLAPELREEVLGHAEVRQVFKVTKVGAIAGCYVTDGTIERNALIRVTRDGIVVEHNRVLEQLKRFKDDAKEVRSGQECGMKIQGYDDIKAGDVLECYKSVEVKRTL